MKKRFLLGIVSLFGPLTLLAQDPQTNYIADTIVTPQFFIAVIAGVLLALGFQFILTALSVALGITAIGDIKENYVHNKYNYNKDDEDDDDGMSAGTMITTGFGLWSIITVGLSLFGATALAINLSLISSTIISITLGLVIWATFFILMFYLESKVVNSLVGGLINTATAGLRASGEAVKGMFSTSKEVQMKHVAEDTVDKIRKDFSATFDPQVINESLDQFFNRVEKSVPDYEQVKKDIQQIIEESDERHERVQKETTKEQVDQQKQQSSGGQGKWMAISHTLDKAISQSSKDGADQNKGKIEKLKQLQKELKKTYEEGGSNEEKLEKVVAKFTPAEEEQVHSYIEKIKNILSQATPQDMDQGKLEDKVMQVIKDPKGTGSKIASRVGEMDRDTIIDILSKNTALERNQIEKYADKVTEILRSFRSSDKVGTSSASDGDMSEIKKKVELAVFKFMNHTGKPDLDFSTLTSLVMGKMDTQGDSLKNIRKKLTNLDRDSLVSMVTSNTNIDQKDIDKVVNSVEDAKTKVLGKIDEIEDEATKRLENLKRKAVIQAEHTRKNAAAAAWWLVISAVLSAGAAIGGSLVALG